MIDFSDHCACTPEAALITSLPQQRQQLSRLTAKENKTLNVLSV